MEARDDTRMPHMSVTLAHIEAARRVIAGHVLPTPMLPAPKLSSLTGANVYVKYENLQVTNSFKERGARCKLASLSADERKRGVIATSAGQYPFAAVVGCIDSRAPAEIILDQGIGDILVLRSAGNVVDTDLLGGLEFAAIVVARSTSSCSDTPSAGPSSERSTG